MIEPVHRRTDGTGSSAGDIGNVVASGTAKPSKLDEILETLSPEIKVNPKFSHPDKPKYGQRRAEARAQILALMLELIEEAMHVETYGLLDKKTLIDSVEAL